MGEVPLDNQVAIKRGLVFGRRYMVSRKSLFVSQGQAKQPSVRRPDPRPNFKTQGHAQFLNSSNQVGLA
jgi:hypothetical protein